MSERNLENTEFDIYTFKENVDKLRCDNNMGVSEFGEKMGIGQGNTSKYLSQKYSNCFTVDQLVKIANYFNVSTDELLGVKPAKKSDTEITLSDVFQTIFNLADITDTELKDHSPSLSESFDIYIDIRFKNQTINKYLREWKELKESNITADTKEHMIEVWEKDLLAKGKYITKESGFSESESKE